MKKKTRKALIEATIALLVLIAICLAVFLTNKPNQVTIAGNTAVIRLPGEFNEEAKILYNSKYAEQTENDSILSLTFKKQGYYLFTIGRTEYVFEVLNIEEKDYTVDLIKTERDTIMLSLFMERICVTAVLWLLYVVAYVAIRVVLNKSKVNKTS